MPFLDWNQEYALGVDALDAHRIAYIEILNEFYKAVMESDVQAEGGLLLHKLKEETQKFHCDEEQMLERVQYGGFAQHCKQHRKFAGKILEIESRHAHGDHAACIQAPRFLLEWLFKHMLQEDLLYQRFLTALPVERVHLVSHSVKSAA